MEEELRYGVLNSKKQDFKIRLRRGGEWRKTLL